MSVYGLYDTGIPVLYSTASGQGIPVRREQKEVSKLSAEIGGETEDGRKRNGEAEGYVPGVVQPVQRVRVRTWGDVHVLRTKG